MSFREILQYGIISTSHCDIFGEPLVYFFYGRPAYRPRSWTSPSASSASCFLPCSVLLTVDAVGPPRRLYPFDSGACHYERYQDYLHPRMTKHDFLLAPSHDMPPRVVGAFYRTNGEYFSGTPSHVDLPPLEFEAQAYDQLIRHKATDELDDRGSAIEIQGAHAIALAKGKVLFVVLPAVFLDDPGVAATLAEWDVPIGTYDSHAGSPREHMGKVYDAVRAFLHRKNYW